MLRPMHSLTSGGAGAPASRATAGNVMTRDSVVTALLALCAQVGMPPSAHTQIPDSFTNLQVLPKDISRDSLLQVMRHRTTTWVALAGLWMGWGLGGATALDAQDFEVAVTVDDLPWSGPTPGDDLVLAANRRILDALATRTVPAVGFVVCDAVRDVRVLRAWLDGGHGLGNHTAAHRDLNDTDPDIWARDVERCHAFLRDFTDAVYFRYPMLHRGRTEQLRDALAEAVRRMGYRDAPVTVDNSEWVIAAQYRAAAAKGDSATMRALGIAYVGHMRRATHQARTIAQARFGRDGGTCCSSTPISSTRTGWAHCSIR